MRFTSQCGAVANERIGACPAHQGVVTPKPLQRVIACTTVQHVIPLQVNRHRDVVPQQCVVTITTQQNICTAASVQYIITYAAIDIVAVRIINILGVATAKASEGVVAGTAIDDIVSAHAIDDIVAIAAIKNIVSVLLRLRADCGSQAYACNGGDRQVTVDDVIVIATTDCVVIVATHQKVSASAANDRVVSFAGPNMIITGACINDVIATSVCIRIKKRPCRRSGDILAFGGAPDVPTFSARHDRRAQGCYVRFFRLGLLYRPWTQVGTLGTVDNVIVASATKDPIIARSAQDQVIVRAAIEVVVTGAAIDAVVAR